MSLQYTADFLSKSAADTLLRWATDLNWQQETFSLYGRSVKVPRLTTWFGDHGLNYRYTGLDHNGEGWPGELKELRECVSRQAASPFNFVLLNRYDHGRHHMGWHRDDEREAAPCIASLSLGSPRRFRHRPGPGCPSEGLDLTHGSLLIFDGRVQHMLCKTTQPTATRINLTFRCIAS